MTIEILITKGEKSKPGHLTIGLHTEGPLTVDRQPWGLGSDLVRVYGGDGIPFGDDVVDFEMRLTDAAARELAGRLLALLDSGA